MEGPKGPPKGTAMGPQASLQVGIPKRDLKKGRTGALGIPRMLKQASRMRTFPESIGMPGTPRDSNKGFLGTPRDSKLKGFLGDALGLSLGFPNRDFYF